MRDELSLLVGTDLAATPKLKISAFTIFGARLSVASEDGTSSATLFGENIFDRYCWYSPQVGDDTSRRWTGAPATYGTTFSVGI